MTLLSSVPWMMQMGFVAYLGINVTASLAMAVVFYFVIERPSLSIKNWVVGTARNAVVARPFEPKSTDIRA
jgi:hypothetical protein